MATWQDFAGEAPELAATARRRFEGHLHHVLATLRADGAPRVSGTEARFHDGDLWLGCMPASRKAADMRRDPRIALHAAPIDTELAQGDAKVDGRAVEVTDPAEIRAYLEAVGFQGDPGDAVAFRIDLDRATLTRVAEDRLVIATWTPGRPVVESLR